MSSIFEGSQSSLVEMTLEAAGRTYKVTHAAPEYLILAAPARLPPGRATLVVSIDGDRSVSPFDITAAVEGQQVFGASIEPQADRVA